MAILNDALRILDREFDTLFTEGSEALDAQAFATCWQRLGSHRDQTIVSLVRKCRQRFRQAQETAAPDEVDLADFVGPLCDFGFRFLSKRQIVLMMDVAALAFESDVLPHTFVKTMGACAANSPYTSKGRIEAAVTGVAGMHRYDAERIDGLDAMDVSPVGGV